jgi:DNA invertase Pin-like site-specific DNA recombinase
MPDVLGYERVSTGDQDVTGQTLRLTQAGAIKVFSDVRSGKTMEGQASRRARGKRSRWFASIALDVRSASCSHSSLC